MSEESQSPESGAGTARACADPAALALTLSGASRERADAFLDDQRAMLHLQMEEMRERNPYEISHFRLRRFSGWARAALEFCAGLIALGLVAVIAVAIWFAAHADGLVIESFTVPPDLSGRGFSGEVVATTLLDKLNLIQDASPNATRPGRALSGGFGDDIKVEIPETGVSAGEAWRFLRRWLGHETHISGEVVRDPAGVGVMVRIDGRNAARYAGPEAALDDLLLKAAEHVDDVTQPSVYGSYLDNAVPPRVAEAQAVLQRGAADLTLPTAERARTFNNLGILQRQFLADDGKSAESYRQAMAIDPSMPVAYSNLAGTELELGHYQATLETAPLALRVFARQSANFYPDVAITLPAQLHAYMASLTGDHAEALHQSRISLAAARAVRRDAARWRIAWSLAGQHDGGAMRDWLATIPPATLPQEITTRAYSQLRAAALLQQWPHVIALRAAAEKGPGLANHYDAATIVTTQVKPWVALALARTGDIAGAQGVIAPTPADCYECVRVRAVIASEARQWARADWWFARAAALAPSIPFAHEDWGRSLLARGRADDAIAQFTLANKKGPHFADPLEGWGEALMAQNRSHLALAKFAAAEKFAPNWGRLQLKWGEALIYAGKKDEAAGHFARAAVLDLTPSEQAEFAKVPHG